MRRDLTKEDYDEAIARGWGDIMTAEGFTIREVRELMWGSDDPNHITNTFEGLGRWEPGK